MNSSPSFDLPLLGAWISRCAFDAIPCYQEAFFFYFVSFHSGMGNRPVNCCFYLLDGSIILLDLIDTPSFCAFIHGPPPYLFVLHFLTLFRHDKGSVTHISAFHPISEREIPPAVMDFNLLLYRYLRPAILAFIQHWPEDRIHPILDWHLSLFAT